MFGCISVEENIIKSKSTYLKNKIWELHENLSFHKQSGSLNNTLENNEKGYVAIPR